MRKQLHTLLLCFVALGLISDLSSANAAPGGGVPVRSMDNLWIARVGNRIVSLYDYIRRYNDFIISNGLKDNLAVRKAILDNMINEELLLHVDRNTEVSRNKDYLTDSEWTRKRTVLAYLKDREIYAKITVTDHEMRVAFARANERLAARHLYTRTEDEANNLYQLLKIGADFNFLAKQVFSDSVLQTNGGYLGYFTWGDMDPAFEETAYSLKVGEISHPVQTALGYSIIKLEDRIAQPLITETQFLQKKPHLERVLKIKKKGSAEREYARRIFNPDRVIFNDANLNGLLNALRTVSAKDVESGKSRGSSSSCASYSGTSYTQNELLQRLIGLPGNQREKIASLVELKAAIKGFLLQEKLLALAHQKGYDTLSVVLDAYAKARESLFLKHRLQEITDVAQFPDSLLYEHYKANIPLFSSEDELNVQEIIVAGRRLADSLRGAILEGADFGATAERYSLRKWSARNKGVLGLAPVARFGQLKETLWSSAVGELVGPISIERYFGLFRVLSKKASEPLPFHLVQDRVKETLKFEQQRTIVGEHLKKLREKVNIEINEQELIAFKVADFASQE